MTTHSLTLFRGHREYRAALEVSASGGQALFLHAWGGPSKIPCFNGVREIGKLFDQDKSRLVATARRLGVRVVHVDRDGQEAQHVDLVAGPLRKAMAESLQESGHEDA